jgi:hypothetical protein
VTLKSGKYNPEFDPFIDGLWTQKRDPNTLGACLPGIYVDQTGRGTHLFTMYSGTVFSLPSERCAGNPIEINRERAEVVEVAIPDTDFGDPFGKYDCGFRAALSLSIFSIVKPEVWCPIQSLSQ